LEGVASEAAANGAGADESDLSVDDFCRINAWEFGARSEGSDLSRRSNNGSCLGVGNRWSLRGFCCIAEDGAIAILDGWSVGISSASSPSSPSITGADALAIAKVGFMIY